METCLRVDVSRLAASASGRGNQRRVESTRDLGESGSGQDMGQQEKPSLSSLSCGSVTSSQDDDWTPGLCFCSLHLPLPDQAGPGVTPPPWSLDRLGSSSDPILWSVSSLCRHRVSVSGPWNVCRACSAAVCRAQGAAQAQPWPAANPGPGSDHSEIADNEEYRQYRCHWFLNGQNIPPHGGQFICLRSQSHSPLHPRPAALDQIYYHRLSWTYFGWLLHAPMLKVKLCKRGPESAGVSI